MLQAIIQKEIKDTMNNKYPHAAIPQTVLAKVTKGGDVINLKILDEFENVDNNFAEIPEIKTNVLYEYGDIVIITFLYGKLEMPIVIRKWEGC